MIPRFDGDAPFADDFGMGYIRYTTEFKLECLRKYFTPPMKPVRVIALETGVPFSTLAEWVTKARKAGMLNSGESLPAMVEVAMPPASAEETTKPVAKTPPSQAVTITIGKATVTLPASMLPQALEALLRQ